MQSSLLSSGTTLNNRVLGGLDMGFVILLLRIVLLIFQILKETTKDE